ncbi:UNVERIFIED_CONTAM: putative inorganic phosphate transporter 1-10 [Sesamum latifolium]|uniref:Inorganic phosphate transporter 1-10 n=1 Tax=Sesamum latifolium TaxID=2727402 RepID=A0AAW2WJ11_9LAMI
MALKVLSALDSAKTQYYHFKAIVVAGMGLFTDAYDLFCIPPIMKLLGRIYYNHRPRHEVPAAVTSPCWAPPSSAPSSVSSSSATSATASAGAASTALPQVDGDQLLMVRLLYVHVQDLRPALPGVLPVHARGWDRRRLPPLRHHHFGVRQPEEAWSFYSGGVLYAGIRDSCELHRDDGGVRRV